MLTTSANTRDISHRRKAEPHSRGTQPKRVVREESTVVAPIVLDSSGETHATVPTTASFAAATSAASSISNLLTSAENELMRVRAARVAKFAYAHSRSPIPPSNPLRISDLPAAAENPTASSSESEGPTRAPTPHLLSETLPIPESTSTPAPPPLWSSSRTRVSDAASVPNPSASATTGDAPIELMTETEVPVESPASPISFSSWNRSRSQWPTFQTRVASPELPSIETSPRNVTIDPREEPRRPPESVSSHWSPLPPHVRAQQTALEQPHISPMKDAVAIVVETNPYTFRDNGVCIDLVVRGIVVVEKRRILLNMRMDVSTISPLDADSRSLKSRRYRSTAADVREYCRDSFGTTEDAVLFILRPRIQTRRPQICTSARAYCRSRTVRASKKRRTL